MSTFPHRFIPMPVLASLLFVAAVIADCAAPAAEPPSEKQPRRDRFGDPLPEEAIYRIGSPRFRVGQRVFFLAFSKDGKTLLSVNEASSPDGGVVRRWDAVTGKQLHHFSLRRIGSDPHSVALSPDGALLAYLPPVEDEAKEAEPITLVEVDSGRVVRTFAKQRHGAGIAFSPDGRTLATSDVQGIIHLWSPDSGKSLGKLEGCKLGTWGMVFAPDGKLLVGGDDKVPRLWDIKGGREVRKFPQEYPHTLVLSTAFSADGKFLAVRTSDSLEVWNTATGEKLWRLRLHANPPFIALAISPDGKLFASANKEDDFSAAEVQRRGGSPAGKLFVS